MRSSSVYTARFDPLALPFDVLSDGIVYSLASQGNQSLYPQANPKLKFVELTSFDDIPENIIYNKVVSVTILIFGQADFAISKRIIQ